MKNYLSTSRKINPEATIQITVGLQAPVGSVDHDPTVGISDGRSSNGFTMWDTNNYGTYAPCYPNSGCDRLGRASAQTLTTDSKYSKRLIAANSLR